MADGNGQCTEPDEKTEMANSNQSLTNMNNNAAGQPSKSPLNGPGVSEEKGITCADRTSNEARYSHALNKGNQDTKAASSSKRSTRIRSRSLSASSTDSYSSGTKCYHTPTAKKPDSSRVGFGTTINY